MTSPSSSSSCRKSTREPGDAHGKAQMGSGPYPGTFTSKRARWKIAIGLHPKAAVEADNQVLQKIRRLVASPHVAALGLIGLDRTVGSDKWAKQEEVFRDLLEMADPAKPVILHIRGEAGDKYACDTHALALLTIKEVCNSSWRIHIRNFVGEPCTLRRWCQAFRHCYFSFSAMAADFDDTQVKTLREVPLDWILLETDSPYLMPRPDQRYNIPAYISDVAQKVGMHVEITRDNFYLTSRTRRKYNRTGGERDNQQLYTNSQKRRKLA
ncbi:uncharacterized metal-dependent hydrolase YcfH-like [Ptychodera flava]|uniref:uncharacterized metal-dependent hydrolase YcfH-like n=1 Tax=Ptychodera flava TaxID=63121 RepID=UPI003969E07D